MKKSSRPGGRRFRSPHAPPNLLPLGDFLWVSFLLKQGSDPWDTEQGIRCRLVSLWEGQRSQLTNMDSGANICILLENCNSKNHRLRAWFRPKVCPVETQVIPSFEHRTGKSHVLQWTRKKTQGHEARMEKTLAEMETRAGRCCSLPLGQRVNTWLFICQHLRSAHDVRERARPAPFPAGTFSPTLS